MVNSSTANVKKVYVPNKSFKSYENDITSTNKARNDRWSLDIKRLLFKPTL